MDSISEYLDRWNRQWSGHFLHKSWKTRKTLKPDASALLEEHTANIHYVPLASTKPAKHWLFYTVLLEQASPVPGKEPYVPGIFDIFRDKWSFNRVPCTAEALDTDAAPPTCAKFIVTRTPYDWGENGTNARKLWLSTTVTARTHAQESEK